MVKEANIGEEAPLVSICCITYNQEAYIRQCIEGFLIQKINFPIEIIIHDDASTDRTAEIIREYQSRYPNIIKPILQKENQYSKRKGILIPFVYPHCKGKYIALCEGDDYWIDPLKLQKQVDFLEKNEEYVLSHSDCNLLYEKTKKIVYNGNKDYLSDINESGKEIFESLLINKYIVRTASVVFRHSVYNEILTDDFKAHYNYFKMGDTLLWLELASKGLFHYLEQVTVVYRINAGTLCRPDNIKKLFRFYLSMYELRIYYADKYKLKNEDILNKIRNKYRDALVKYRLFEPDFVTASFIDTSFVSGNWKLKLLQYRPIAFVCSYLIKARYKLSDIKHRIFN